VGGRGHDGGGDGSEDSPLEFPCEYPVKAMGLAGDEFEILVVSIISCHVSGLWEGAVQTRPSRGGKYVAVTVTVWAENRAQLESIYKDLHADERVLMLL